MAVVIRNAEIFDLPCLMRLIRAKAAFDGAADALHINETGLRDALFGPQPKMRALVAVANDTVVGIATYYDIYSSFLGKPGLWLDDLYVDEASRSAGIGHALIKALCAQAQGNGCARIDWLVAAGNTRGKQFYKTVGAKMSENLQHARLDLTAILALARQ